MVNVEEIWRRAEFLVGLARFLDISSISTLDLQKSSRVFW
jgi:hypothetical protein